MIEYETCGYCRSVYRTEDEDPVFEYRCEERKREDARGDGADPPEVLDGDTAKVVDFLPLVRGSRSAGVVLAVHLEVDDNDGQGVEGEEDGDDLRCD